MNGRSAASVVVPLLVLAACDSGDNGVKVFNTNPNAEIAYPEDGGSVDAGGEVTMSGTGSDPESAEDALLGTWMIDGEIVCDTVNLDSTGITECTTIFDAGSYTIGLTVTDPSGGSTTVTHSIVVNPSNAPEVQITAPTTSGVYYGDRTTTFEGLVSDVEDAPNELVVAWSSDMQGDLGVSGAPSEAGLTTGDAVLEEGNHEITLTATDTDGLSSIDVVMVTVLATNTPPTCGITSPVDGSYNTSGSLVELVGIASDPDIASEYLTATWESDREGLIIEEAVNSTGETAHSTDTLGVGTHQITLTVTDDGGEICTDTVAYTVGTPPTVSIDAPFDGDVVNEGDLTNFIGSAVDLEDSGVDIDIQWSSTLDGTLDESPPDSEGYLEFATDELVVGEHEIRLRATDTDGLYSDATIALRINGLPTAPVVSIAPSTPYTVDDLVVSVDVDSTDSEGDTMSYGYDWTVGGVSAGITSDTVPASSTSKGEVWEVTVTPFDGLGIGEVAVVSVEVANSPPTVDAAPTLTPEPAYEGDVLTCTLGVTSDDDGDTVSDSYSWFVNSVSVAASSATLGSTYFDSGDTVYCVQTPNDGTDVGVGVSSNVVTISNTVPTVSDVAISPDPATAGDSLTCSYTFADVDGDSDSSSVAWTVGSTAAGTGTTLSSGFVRGDVVVCEVTPNDGSDDGTADSASITISNSAPEISSVTVTPDPSVTADDLTCSVDSSSDVDSDTISFAYAWYVNGASVGVTSDTLSSAYHIKNDLVYCLVTPNDSYEDGTTVQSNVVTTGNTAPVMSSVSLSPSSPGTESLITASVSSSDEDTSDTVSYTYDWYVDTILEVTGSSSTLDGSYFVRGEDVYVSVTPSDGMDDGSAMTSAVVTIVNTGPTAPGLVFDPTSPEQELDDLICDLDSASYDADGDSISYTFSWTYDGVAYTGATTTSYTGDTVPAADTALGFDWICTVTPDDGFTDGTAESILVTVIDVTNPDAPTLDTPTRFRNIDDIELSGTCVYGDCFEVVVDCDSTSLSQTDTVSCQSDDSFAASFEGLSRDETTLCTAYCLDSSSNASSDSNTVSTDVCDPEDTYEDDVGTGDTDADAIEPWAILDDSGSTTHTISANILSSDTVDWYLVETSDDLAADQAANIDYYSLDVRLLDADTGLESSDYLMTVFKGAPTTAECSGTLSGYTAYTDYVYDNLDGSSSHTTPSDRRQCELSHYYNDCEDFSNTYYIKVERVSASVTSCVGYEVSVTNNGGVCNTSTECPN